MGKENTVTGQMISPVMLKRAKELRRNITPAERRLWDKLRANRLDGWHFRRQQIIGRFIVDFYCHKADLIIEVDGPIHKIQKTEDAERTKALVGKGLKMLRFSNREVMNDMNLVLKTIEESLESVFPFLVKERG